MLVAGKLKYTHKTLREKCQALKDLEKGESNKDLAAKYNVPKNTLSTWVKNKEELFDALKKGTNAKKRKPWNRQETAIAEDDDPFRELQDKIVQPNLIKEDVDANTFADVDVEVIAVQSPPSDAEIVAELLETEGVMMMIMIIPLKLLKFCSTQLY